ncbi:MAG: replication-associated recombination protein A [Candidatus Shapirobacteria bacterium]
MEKKQSPLADQIRPKNLKEFVGQEHLVGRDGIIRRMMESDQLFSMIFWGPAGVGKTTLARLIAQTTKAHFLNYSAVSTKLNDIRQAIIEAKKRRQEQNQRTILFLDEIHRFNKAQQDAFLPHVENGTLILIGATTENPSFEVIGPLLSRSRVFTLKPLNLKPLNLILTRGLKEIKRKIDPKAKELLLNLSNGDARILLNALEIADSIDKTKKKISLQLIKSIFERSSLFYDRLGEEHYNIISAFIKSMRASNADAALYYLSRMVEAGEDPLFIARRMVIFASEDIGVALPTALVVANAVFRACESIGYPECAINLAHGVVYLTKAPKNRTAYDALRAAQEDVRLYGNLPIPLELRNAPTKLMKNLGYGSGYQKYTDKDLLPEKLKGKKYFK